MAGLNPSPDTQAALGDQVSGAFAGEAKYQSSKVTEGQKAEIGADIDFRRAEEQLRGLGEANPVVLDAAVNVLRGMASFVEWRGNRISGRAVERARRAQDHEQKLAEIKQRPIEDAEKVRKAEIANEVLRVLELPGGAYAEVRGRSFTDSLRGRWHQHWADVDTRRAKRDEASAEGYLGGAAKLRAAALAVEEGWRTTFGKHGEGAEAARVDAEARKGEAAVASRAAQEAYDRVMAQGPAEAIAAREEIMRTGPESLATQKGIVEERTGNVVKAATG